MKYPHREWQFPNDPRTVIATRSARFPRRWKWSVFHGEVGDFIGRGRAFTAEGALRGGRAVSFTGQSQDTRQP